MENEAYMGIVFGAVAVEDGVGDSAGILGIGAANGYWFAEEVDVSVSRAVVCAGLDFHGVAVICDVYCGLDVVEVCGAVVVYGDYPSGRAAGKQQGD